MAFAKSIGFEVLNLDYSPIKGPEGNIEYLMQIKKVALEEVAEVCEEVSAEEAKEPVMTAESALTETELSKIKEVVQAAHASLD